LSSQPPDQIPTITKSTERRQQPRDQIAFLDRRTWQLWFVSLSVTAALAVAFAALFYPAIKWQVYQIEPRHGTLPQLIAGLLTLVFLQGLYIIKKQRDLNELRDFIITAHAETLLVAEMFPVDRLTGALDRRCLPELVARECAWADRYGIPLTLVLFDIRGFGKLNEKEGNLAGDLTLKELAATLRATMRHSDAIMRHASDAFLCFLPRTDRDGGDGFIHRALKACQAASRLRGLSLDYGVAVHTAGVDPDQVVVEVERDLEAKKLQTPAAVTAGRPAVGSS
jgi:diguanylate cyclase (GGDEF)-like protein